MKTTHIAWLVLAILIAGPLAAHIGSPDVFFQGDAGPYHLVVSIRTPQMIPGIAEIQIRSFHARREADQNRSALHRRRRLEISASAGRAASIQRRPAIFLRQALAHGFRLLAGARRSRWRCRLRHDCRSGPCCSAQHDADAEGPWSAARCIDGAARRWNRLDHRRRTPRRPAGARPASRPRAKTRRPARDGRRVC